MIFTLKQIESLRPTFKLGDSPMSMVDWFEVRKSDTWCSIRSGLNHADGVTKSPYFYEHSEVGRKANKISREKFTDWFNNLNTNT